MDALRHVNNVQFLRFLEDARVQMLIEIGRRSLESELSAVVVRHEIDYRKPLLYRTEPVMVDTWVTHIGRTSYSVAYDVREESGDVVYAHATTVIVSVESATGRPTELDATIRAGLARFLDDGVVSDGDATIAGLVADAVTAPAGP